MCWESERLTCWEQSTFRASCGGSWNSWGHQGHFRASLCMEHRRVPSMRSTSLYFTAN